MAIDLSGRVAIVTGAGTGIGEAIAVALARRGAAVVVNDYGGDVYGKGGGSSARADDCVARILASGGKAVANGDAVGTTETAKSIVGSALDQFGRLDILVNNAGFGDSGAMDEVDEPAYNRGMATHLLGPRALMHAAWPIMRRQKFGRIINTSSSVSFGRAHYSNFASSKAGLIGLSRAAGLEGAEHGILVNAILPTADTRATRTGLEAAGELRIRDWFIEHFPPTLVGEAVAYLASPEATVSGEAFVVGGGRFARMGYAIAPGYFDPGLTAESVADHIDEAMDFTGATIVLDNHSEQNSYMAFIPRP